MLSLIKENLSLIFGILDILLRLNSFKEANLYVYEPEFLEKPIRNSLSLRSSIEDEEIISKVDISLPSLKEVEYKEIEKNAFSKASKK